MVQTGKEVARAGEVIDGKVMTATGEIKEGQAVVVPAARRDAVYYDEGGELDRSVIQNQIVRLVQKDTEAGRFKRIDTGETYEKLRIVPLLIQRGRLKWPAGQFRSDSKPECWSIDGVQGDPRPTFDGRKAVKAGQACLTCPFYTTKVAGDRDKGLCHTQHNAVFLNMDTGEPFIFRFAGMVNLDAPAVMGPKKNPHLRRRVLLLESIKVKNPSGDYYRLRVTTGADLTDEQRNESRDLFEAAKQWEMTMRQEEIQGETSDDSGPAGDPLANERPPHPAETASAPDEEGSPW